MPSLVCLLDESPRPTPISPPSPHPAPAGHRTMELSPNPCLMLPCLKNWRMGLPARCVGCLHASTISSTNLRITMGPWQDVLQRLHPHQTTELPLCRSSAKKHLVCSGCKPFGRHMIFHWRLLRDYVVLHLRS